MQAFHIYIYFPENPEEYIKNEEEGRKILKDFQMAIYLADCEKGSLVYYSKSNKDSFFNNLHAFEELSNLKVGSYDFETVVNTFFIENNILAISEDNKTGCQIKIYNSYSNGLDTDLPSVFNAIVTKSSSLRGLDKQIILNFFNAFLSQNPVLIIVDCNGDVNTITVPFVTNCKSLFDWLKESRINRSYNFNDNRHIENHPQSQIVSHKKSPLLGGLAGKQNASDLLNKAIGDKRLTKDLIYFDEFNEQYIWYEFENDTPQNQYHGYHLVIPGTYASDVIAIKKIPERVVFLLEYLKD
jgi:hypothetical protein